MKKYKLFISTLILISIVSIFNGCSKEASSDITIIDEYVFEDLAYLSPLSSATYDYAKDGKKNTLYQISEKSITIIENDNEILIDNITYQKEEMPEDFFDEHVKLTDYELSAILGNYENNNIYYIYNEQNELVNYCIITTDRDVYFCSYIPDKLIFLDIDKIKLKDS